VAFYSKVVTRTGGYLQSEVLRLSQQEQRDLAEFLKALEVKSPGMEGMKPVRRIARRRVKSGLGAARSLCLCDQPASHKCR